jgi:hypothetical protein
LDQHGALYFHEFSFSQNAMVRVPSPEGAKGDLSCLYSSRHNGSFRGFVLGVNPSRPSFHLVGSRSTLDSGRALFDGLACISDTATFHDFGLPVEPYQVWAVKTHDGTFAKILIVDTFFCSQTHDSAGKTVTETRGEVTFDWQWQPDGTRCFGEP